MINQDNCGGMVDCLMLYSCTDIATLATQLKNIWPSQNSCYEFNIGWHKGSSIAWHVFMICCFFKYFFSKFWGGCAYCISGYANEYNHTANNAGKTQQNDKVEWSPVLIEILRGHDLVKRENVIIKAWPRIDVRRGHTIVIRCGHSALSPSWLHLILAQMLQDSFLDWISVVNV